MKQRAIFAAILLLLGVAALQVSLVTERLTAAIFQWHHFGSSWQSGYINLSKETAMQFYGLSLACLGVGIFMARIAHPATTAGRVFIWSPVALLSLGVFAYAALSFSPLNVWRP